MWWLTKISNRSFLGSPMTSEAKNAASVAEDMCIWLEIPEGVDPGNCKVVDTEGVLSLVESTDKTGPCWDVLRSERNAKLAACDWTQLEDSPLDAEIKEDWSDYRNLLRDLPENTTDPLDITWPEEP